MKKIILSLLILSIGALVAAFRPKELQTLAVGADAPMMTHAMKSIDGDMYSLKQTMGKNGLVVIFTCNTCPFVVGAEGYGTGWEGRYAGLNGACAKTEIGIIYVNSNETKRDKGDGLKEMKERAEKYDYADAPYVLDVNSELANAFGARTTPHVFVFDKNAKLVYRGAIDDSSESPAGVKQPYLLNTINCISHGKKVDPSDTKPVGCSIKRVL